MKASKQLAKLKHVTDLWMQEGKKWQLKVVVCTIHKYHNIFFVKQANYNELKSDVMVRNHYKWLWSLENIFEFFKIYVPEILQK